MKIVNCLVLLALIVLGGCQGEGAYPDRAVTLVVLDPAGGPTDLVARQLVEIARPDFPQPLVVLNRPGGAGTIAAAEVVRAAPDGYTVGLQAVGPMALQPHRNELPYRTVDDYTPVLKLVNQPLVLAVRADAPWPGPAELLAEARANPGRLRVALPGAGTIAQLVVDLLQRQAGAVFVPVPFGSAGEAVLALLNGSVEAAIVGPPTLVGQVEAGRARVLGAFEERRDPLFPQAPTFREAGHDVTLGGYFFIIAPKGTPPAALTRLHDTFKRALESERFRAWAPGAGLAVDYAGPEALRQQLARDYTLFGELLRP
ncbi:MAG: tripartite tricarboxylate transporter substrate binding protein [Chloroflexota bacterium]